MTNTYRPVAGDRVRFKYAIDRLWSHPHDVKWAGDRVVVLTKEHGFEIAKDTPSYEWEKIIVYPERWWIVYEGNVSAGYVYDPRGTRVVIGSAIGILHLLPDGTSVMEKV